MANPFRDPHSDSERCPEVPDIGAIPFESAPFDLTIPETFPPPWNEGDPFSILIPEPDAPPGCFLPEFNIHVSSGSADTSYAEVTPLDGDYCHPQIDLFINVPIFDMYFDGLCTNKFWSPEPIVRVGTEDNEPKTERYPAAANIKPRLSGVVDGYISSTGVVLRQDEFGGGVLPGPVVVPFAVRSPGTTPQIAGVYDGCVLEINGEVRKIIHSGRYGLGYGLHMEPFDLIDQPPRGCFHDSIIGPIVAGVEGVGTEVAIYCGNDALALEKGASPINADCDNINVQNFRVPCSDIVSNPELDDENNPISPIKPIVDDDQKHNNVIIEATSEAVSSLGTVDGHDYSEDVNAKDMCRLKLRFTLTGIPFKAKIVRKADITEGGDAEPKNYWYIIDLPEWREAQGNINDPDLNPLAKNIAFSTYDETSDTGQEAYLRHDIPYGTPVLVYYDDTFTSSSDYLPATKPRRSGYKFCLYEEPQDEPCSSAPSPLLITRSLRMRLLAYPAGTLQCITPSADAVHTILCPDLLAPGWLPVSALEGTVTSQFVPEGALFWYNMPMDPCGIGEEIQAYIAEAMGKSVPTGVFLTVDGTVPPHKYEPLNLALGGLLLLAEEDPLVIINIGGIWWTKNTYGNVPWPDSLAVQRDCVYSGYSCPRTPEPGYDQVGYGGYSQILPLPERIANDRIIIMSLAI